MPRAHRHVDDRVTHFDQYQRRSGLTQLKMGTFNSALRTSTQRSKLGRTLMANTVGHLDRAVRIAVGLAVLGSPLAWYGPENISAWGYLGLIPFMSGVLGTCPIYALLGWSTCRKPS